MSDKSGRVTNQRGIVRFTVPKVPGRVVEERPRYNVVTALLRDRFGTLKVKNISRNNILQNYCNISHCESQQWYNFVAANLQSYLSCNYVWQNSCNILQYLATILQDRSGTLKSCPQMRACKNFTAIHPYTHYTIYYTDKLHCYTCFWKWLWHSVRMRLGFCPAEPRNWKWPNGVGNS